MGESLAMLLTSIVEGRPALGDTCKLCHTKLS